MNATTVAIDVTESAPRYWCAHDNDSHSIAITADDRGLSVYLHGTLDELNDFAERIITVCALQAVTVER